MSAAWEWPALFFLGCYHGINPGMGWLFAVALGLQERSTRAVFGAMVPITIGHLISVAAVVMLALLITADLPYAIVHRATALLLFGFGAYKLIRVRHPRWVGMRVGFWGLVVWAFLMASAHGAGLMLLPFITVKPSSMSAMDMPMPAPSASHYGIGWLMIAVHTLGYLLTMAAVAFVIYKKFGLSILRTAWLNVDTAWAIALFVTGAIALAT